MIVFKQFHIFLKTVERIHIFLHNMQNNIHTFSSVHKMISEFHTIFTIFLHNMQNNIHTFSNIHKMIPEFHIIFNLIQTSTE